MRVGRWTAGLVIGLCVALTGSANAATILDIQGEVLISTGTGFLPVSGPTEVVAGHQVFVRPGGSAQILFDDGCKVPIQPDTVVQVGATSPCATANAGGGSPLSTPVIVGGVVVAGGVALAVGLSGGGKKDKPASP